MILEVDSFPEPPEQSSNWLEPSFGPCDTLSLEPRPGTLDSDLQNAELIKEYGVKPLSLWEFF